MNLSKEDFKLILDLDQECMGNESWTPESWEGLRASDKEAYLLLLHESKKAFILFLTPKVDDTAHLLKIAVSKDFRGQGLSRQLFQEASLRLLGDGFCKIYLEVRTDNDAAVGLYRSLGFKIVHKCRNFYKNGQDAYKMLLEIAQKL